MHETLSFPLPVRKLFLRYFRLGSQILRLNVK